jgi:hypothetical protein
LLFISLISVKSSFLLAILILNKLLQHVLLCFLKLLPVLYQLFIWIKWRIIRASSYILHFFSHLFRKMVTIGQHFLLTFSFFAIAHRIPLLHLIITLLHFFLLLLCLVTHSSLQSPLPISISLFCLLCPFLRIELFCIHLRK